MIIIAVLCFQNIYNCPQVAVNNSNEILKSSNFFKIDINELYAMDKMARYLCLLGR